MAAVLGLTSEDLLQLNGCTSAKRIALIAKGAIIHKFTIAFLCFSQLPTASFASDYTLVSFERSGRMTQTAVDAEALKQCKSAGFDTLVSVVKSGMFVLPIQGSAIVTYYVALCMK